MAGRFTSFFILLLLALSVILRSPPLFLLDVLLALLVTATELWGRYCLAEVTYARRFAADRLFCGEETEVWVEIANAKPLPLAWLKAEDEFPSEFTVHHHELGYSSKPRRRTLVNLLSLRWYERVRRRYRLTADRRGAFEFGPVRLASGDLFGFRTRFADLEQSHTVLVYPRLVALERLGLRAARPSGNYGAERRLVADPLRLAGARDYQSGDSLRHVHWKATARRGSLQTKVFDPGASRPLVLFLNSQTMQRAHEGVVGDLFETAIVAAAAIAWAGLDAHHAVGLFTNGGVKGAERRPRLLPSRQPEQFVRILETLAQLTFFSFLSFDELLRAEASRLPYGATLIAISAIVGEPLLSALLDLRAAGHPVALMVIGGPPADPLPPELPVYFVTESWTTLESVDLPEKPRPHKPPPRASRLTR
jgi:uncharacterized protein (DUF58 family)